ncbi:uncharacterized protein ACIB01_012161 isoform 1-T1 [Guaruba guarouba]
MLSRNNTCMKKMPRITSEDDVKKIKQVSKQNRLRGQEPTTSREEVILSGQSKSTQNAPRVRKSGLVTKREMAQRKPAVELKAITTENLELKGQKYS